MSDETSAGEPSVRQQLEAAVRDLWSLLQDSGDDFVVFMDRRRLSTRVQRAAAGHFEISWEGEDGRWVQGRQTFDNPREAAFHAYQGPH